MEEKDKSSSEKGNTNYSTTEVRMKNPFMKYHTPQNLTNLGIRGTTDFVARFSDVKFVCLTSTDEKAKKYADIFSAVSDIPISLNLCRGDRYVLYKTGPVLWLSHGIGNASLSAAMEDMIKLLHYATAKGVSFFKISAGGSIGVVPGTIVVVNGVCNHQLQPSYVQYVLGRKVERPTSFDTAIHSSLMAVATQVHFSAVAGKTFSADDFYEGEARLDGLFCEYTKKNKLDFLHELFLKGVRSFDMEAACFSAICHRAGIRAASVCGAMHNYVLSDEVMPLGTTTVADFERLPFKLVAAYLLLRVSTSHPPVSPTPVPVRPSAGSSSASISPAPPGRVTSARYPVHPVPVVPAAPATVPAPADPAVRPTAPAPDTRLPPPAPPAPATRPAPSAPLVPPASADPAPRPPAPRPTPSVVPPAPAIQPTPPAPGTRLAPPASSAPASRPAAPVFATPPTRPRLPARATRPVPPIRPPPANRLAAATRPARGIRPARAVRPPRAVRPTRGVPANRPASAAHPGAHPILSK